MLCLILMVLTLVGGFIGWTEHLAGRVEALNFLGIITIVMVLASNFGSIGLQKKLLPLNDYKWVGFFLVLIIIVTELMIWKFA